MGGEGSRLGGFRVGLFSLGQVYTVQAKLVQDCGV